MLFLIVMTGQTGFTFRKHPGVRRMTGRTGAACMGVFLMQTTDLAMAGSTICQGMNLLLLEMAGFALQRRHGSGCRDLVTLRTAQDRRVPQLVATMAEEVGVLP